MCTARVKQCDEPLYPYPKKLLFSQERAAGMHPQPSSPGVRGRGMIETGECDSPVYAPFKEDDIFVRAAGTELPVRRAAVLRS